MEEDGLPIRKIVPRVLLTAADQDLIPTVASGLFISALFMAAPEPTRIVGPFQILNLTDPQSTTSFQTADELGNDERLLLQEIEARLTRALEKTGFDLVREPGFADRVFVSKDVVGFAYASVVEHLTVKGKDDFDDTGTLLDPILSARTLTLLAQASGEPSAALEEALERPLRAIEQVVLRSNEISKAQLALHPLEGASAALLAEKQLDWLRRAWRRLVDDELPRASKTRRWPVSQDHCFARILLDHACGRPWREEIKPPAWRNAREETMIAALRAGESVLAGEADLHELNHQSLRMRGKLN